MSILRAVVAELFAWTCGAACTAFQVPRWAAVVVAAAVGGAIAAARMRKRRRS
jgi:hypothetical protein